MHNYVNVQVREKGSRWAGKGSYLQPGRESVDLKRKWGWCLFCESIKTQKTLILLSKDVNGGGKEEGVHSGREREVVTEVICGVKITLMPKKIKVVYLCGNWAPPLTWSVEVLWRARHWRGVAVTVVHRVDSKGAVAGWFWYGLPSIKAVLESRTEPASNATAGVQFISVLDSRPYSAITADGSKTKNNLQLVVKVVPEKLTVFVLLVVTLADMFLLNCHSQFPSTVLLCVNFWLSFEV